MKTRMPITVKIASLIWLVYGSLLLIGGSFGASIIVTLMFSLRLENLGLFMYIPFILIVLFSVVLSFIFLYIGLQTLKGKAKDVFGSGVYSLVSGLFGMLGILLLFLKGKNTLNPDLIVGFLLLLAGILVLIGRKQYKEWVSSKRNI